MDNSKALFQANRGYIGTPFTVHNPSLWARKSQSSIRRPFSFSTHLHFKTEVNDKKDDKKSNKLSVTNTLRYDQNSFTSLNKPATAPEHRKRVAFGTNEQQKQSQKGEQSVFNSRAPYYPQTFFKGSLRQHSFQNSFRHQVLCHLDTHKTPSFIEYFTSFNQNGNGGGQVKAPAVKKNISINVLRQKLKSNFCSTRDKRSLKEKVKMKRFKNK